MFIIETIAIHEAGHCAARCRLGLALGRVWIADNAGHTEHDGDMSKPFESAVASLAGPQAVHYLLPAVDPKYGGDADFREARTALACIDGSADALWQLAWQRVRELVAAEEHAIRAIARELLKHRELSGYAVWDLYSGALPATLKGESAKWYTYP